MIFFGNRWRFYTAPRGTVYLLIGVNIVVYAWCLKSSNTTVIPVDLLLRSGAMVPAAVAQHEYWRFISYGFLHANLLHLLSNLVCLGLWGGLLEKRVGSFYFIVIYAISLVGAAVASAVTHPGPFLMVGASGAISGVLGALLGLWILGKSDLSVDFFGVNIGLNVALAFTAPNIDWRAHLGGFVAGMIASGLLDNLERVMSLVLRCKFPEFVKVNGLVAVAAFSAAVLPSGLYDSSFHPEEWLPVAAYGFGIVALVKFVDVVLSVKKGLAIVVIAFALANAVLVVWTGSGFASMLLPYCLPGGFQQNEVEQAVRLICADSTLSREVAALCIFVLTILLYRRELYRGIIDVGFVAASFRAERRRRKGI
jgi:membrane associated rhomboid family serine protease